MEFIDIKTQYQRHKEEIDTAIQEVLESGQFIMGNKIQEVEEALAEYVGARHCVTVSSGTDSLLLSLMALGVKAGDEVITTPFTFVSTVEVIAFLGATPVYVDIDLETYNLNPELIESAITEKTKAIMPVNMFGQMADYSAINAIAEKHGLAVVEDGAQSFGATQNGIHSMNATHIGSTSFFPAKPLGCYGDGGALFTNDDAFATKFRELRIHGGLERHKYTSIGLNARFDALQAAVILVKLRYFAEEVKQRQTIGKRYTEHLKDVCTTPTIKEGNTSTYAIYTIRHPLRDALSSALSEKGIPTGIYYPFPIFHHAPYQNGTIRKENFPNTLKACAEVLGLPMHPWLTEESQDQIIETIKEWSEVTV